MNVSILKSTVKHHRFQQASFIQSACGPYVIKIDYLADDGKTSSALLKDKHNQVMSFKGVGQQIGITNRLPKARKPDRPYNARCVLRLNPC
jgi:hypothetical protein